MIDQRVQQWLDGPYDDKTKERIRELQRDNPKTLEDCFYTDISFGTGGMRGLMDVGPNRLNVYTIQRAALGLAKYLLKHTSSPKVLIGYDSRHNSALFAKRAARSLAAQGIHVYLFKHLRPTPLVSFGCRHLHCSAAIMITASHNPPEYNGFKVYWKDGAQVVAPHDKGIMEEVEKITDSSNIPLSPEDSPLITLVEEEIDRAYLQATLPLAHFPHINREKGKSLSITYTSLHGTGITLVPQALAAWGFTSFSPVQIQCIPDGAFPTARTPNPEFKEALALGIEQMVKTNSDLFIATDPDADRMGVALLHHGKPVILTGNEIASICVHHICTTLTKKKEMPPRGAFVTTIVSTELQKAIAAAFGRPCFEVLTGFKYIGEKIGQWEHSSDGYHFLFGAEESYGYLLGTIARDKDGITAACLISEIALQAKLEGKTLFDLLQAIYRTYGVFREKQLSIDFASSKEGMERIQALMKHLRDRLPTTLCGYDVTAIEDYETGVRYLLLSGEKEPLALPKSDVLLFRLGDSAKLVIRPSGTEPKLKIYAAVREAVNGAIEGAIGASEKRLEELIQAAQHELS